MKKLLISMILLLPFFLLLPIFNSTVTAADEVAVKKVASDLDYSWISSFSEGLAPAHRNYKHGYIDRAGKEVIPFEYDDCRNFVGGLAAVYKDGWGVIDKTGKIIVPLEYAIIESYSENMAAVSSERNGQYGRGGLINWGFLDETGRLAIPCQYERAASFSEGLAAVRKDGKWGYIDKTGKVVVPFEYDSAGFFKEGLALVSVWDMQHNDGYYGFIDKTGEVIVPLEYELAFNYSEGLAGVMKDRKSGYIDKTGKIAIPLIYDSFDRPFKDGLANVIKDNKWGYIDKSGNTVISFEYNYAESFSDDMAVVMDRNAGKFAFIDKMGRFITKYEYDQVFEFKDGLALVRKDDEESLYGKNGIYDSRDFKCYWGFIDKTGKPVIPIEYTNSSYLNEGLIPMEKDGRWSIFQVSITKSIDVTFGATGYILNGEPFEQQTMVYNGAAYLPAAYLATKLGLTAKWDAETNTTTLTSLGEKPPASVNSSFVPSATPITKTITVTFGATRYILNNQPLEQDTMVYNEVAYLPAAYLASKLGLTVIWDAETNITTLLY